MFSMDVKEFAQAYVFMTGVEMGAWQPRLLRAVWMPDSDSTAIKTASLHLWRIGEAELIRWMRYANFYIYDPFLLEDGSTDEELLVTRPGVSDARKEAPDDDLLAL